MRIQCLTIIPSYNCIIRVELRWLLVDIYCFSVVKEAQPKKEWKWKKKLSIPPQLYALNPLKYNFCVCYRIITISLLVILTLFAWHCLIFLLLWCNYKHDATSALLSGLLTFARSLNPNSVIYNIASLKIIL